MAKLAFNGDDVRTLVEHTKHATSHKTLYGRPGTDTPGLWLVKDAGVYLMSNATETLPAVNGTDDVVFVVYADGFNPHTMDAGQVYDRAREVMGGDDGATLLPLDTIEQALAINASTLLLNVTRRHISVLIARPAVCGARMPKVGDRVRVKASEWIKPDFHGLTGTVVNVKRSTFAVRLDNGRGSVRLDALCVDILPS